MRRTRTRPLRLLVVGLLLAALILTAIGGVFAPLAPTPGVPPANTTPGPILVTPAAP